MDNFNKLTQMAVSKLPYIQIQLVYIGSLPKVDKSRVCVPPHFLASSYATDIVLIYYIILYYIILLYYYITLIILERDVAQR